HLFNPALVSTQTLAFAPGTGPEFARVAAKFGGGRVIASDFEPKKVVLAILLKRGAPLDVDTLFPFSQVTLAHTATVLHQRHRAELEVIGIPQPARTQRRPWIIPPLLNRERPRSSGRCWSRRGSPPFPSRPGQWPCGRRPPSPSFS